MIKYTSFWVSTKIFFQANASSWLNCAKSARSLWAQPIQSALRSTQQTRWKLKDHYFYYYYYCLHETEKKSHILTKTDVFLQYQFKAYRTFKRQKLWFIQREHTHTKQFSLLYQCFNWKTKEPSEFLHLSSPVKGLISFDTKIGTTVRPVSRTVHNKNDYKLFLYFID